ncbi:glycoside hydrolase family 3 N-terminal domain-containing protein [Pontibacter harenae]|uniref:glycoside hydrolase family 3 N-terminal domain-containing protein n=1 Tax=Pontibacter harenae TaxID=2894083 RepID=UPI001E2B8081|nr:glycoside hydrolase family 3 N-terminal domain-containing protein [Pontibacter harenae]MCC9168904.1 serine hydrolase [Pontibacter harenae]
MLKRFSLGLLILLFLGMGPLMSHKPSEEAVVDEQEKAWVDSVYNALTPDQRIGQLFMVAAYSNKDEKHFRQIDTLVMRYGIGGLMFMQGGPVRQAKLNNRYQAEAKVPLLVAMDAEWGLGMRLDSSMSFARQMTLGAIDDDRYIYLMGREIALKMKRLGVHVSFSPVMDVNVNPANPVIGNRSFGESKEEVTKRGIAYIKGLQDHGIIAVAKHFPGHGDTDTDSHLSLPVVQHNIKRLNEVELYPFKQAFDAGVMGVMVAHLYLPSVDSTRNLATTLSQPLVTGLLKEKMNYKGLVFTDALNMKGVTKYHKPGEVDLKALMAGNDVLLFPEDVPTAISKIRAALKAGLLDSANVNHRVKKILHAKYWAGLNNYKPVELQNLQEEIDRPISTVVQEQLYEHAVTVLQNKDGLLPFRYLDTLKIASVAVGVTEKNKFQETLGYYAPVTKFAISDRFAPDTSFTSIIPKLKDHDVVVVSIHNMNSTPYKDFGIGINTRAFIKYLQEQTDKKVVVAVMGNAYSLKYFEGINWLVCGYEDNAIAQSLVPQVLFGARAAKGKLPVTASAKFKSGTGVATIPLNRLKYGSPESVGMDPKMLAQVDNIALEAIAYAATPGAQVLVVKDGTVVYNKSYGYYTYDKEKPVTNNTIYDIASITKVAATLQAIMFLKDQGKINLDEKVSAYLPELKGTNKENIVMRDVLTHQAGLLPGLPYWQNSLKAKQLFYASTQNDIYPNEVSPGFFSNIATEDTVWAWTVKSKLLPLRKDGKGYDYKYSDLDFYVLKRVAEQLLNQPLDEFLDQNFYAPLGLSTMMYKPLQKHSPEDIAPTEKDTYFRHSLLQGTVHDQGAAMLGGVAGHAGLFSNANDLAVLLQMNLQDGVYGGHQYFGSKVVTEFSKKQFSNSRRGLGWDKPDPDGNGPTSSYASLSTFGHTGFTGTGAWVDPENNLIYIFLSNRVYPDAGSNKLVKYNIRTRIHDVIYQAFVPKT